MAVDDQEAAGRKYLTAKQRSFRLGRKLTKEFG